MAFQSIEELLQDNQKHNEPLWITILRSDCIATGLSQEESLQKMAMFWDAMKTSIDAYDPKEFSNSQLVGTDGEKITNSFKQGLLFGDAFLNDVIACALKIAECNACMKRIVAMPTAGSCGVIPAVLLPLVKHKNYSDEQIIHALYIGAGFGQVIALRASISGAQGGCQAEVGTASAMAAATMTYLGGGSPQMCSYSCAMALSNLLGLVCDPIAGLVEVPCVQRNVVGAVNALSCANMALAGISHQIPTDEVIDAMRTIGETMSSDLKETARGGLAATPTAIKLVKAITQQNQRVIHSNKTKS